MMEVDYSAMHRRAARSVLKSQGECVIQAAGAAQFYEQAAAFVEKHANQGFPGVTCFDKSAGVGSSSEFDHGPRPSGDGRRERFEVFELLELPEQA